MFAADAQLDVRAGGAAEFHGNLHQLADAVLVNGSEDVLLDDFQFLVLRQEGAGVVAAHAQARLGQVIGAEGEELGGFRDFVSRDGSARDFNHGADEVVHFDAFFLKYLLGHLVNDGFLDVQFLLEGHQRNHDFRHHGKSFFLGDFHSGFKDGAGLHFRDFRIGNAETAAAMAEHRVELMEFRHAAHDDFHRHADFLGQVKLLFLRLGKEFVQGRVQKADGARQALERLEDALEVPLLVGEELGNGGYAVALLGGEDHFTDEVDPVPFKEHVFRAAEADAGGAEGDSGFRLLGRVRIGAHFHFGAVVAPLHELGEVLVGAAVFRLHGLGNQDLDDFRGGSFHLAGVYQAARSVNGEVVTFADGYVANGNGAVVVVHNDFIRAANADFAHLAGNEGGMGGNAAAGGQDAFSGNHAAQVFRRGFQTDQQNLFTSVRGFHAAFRVQVDASGGGAGPGGKTAGQNLGTLDGFTVKDGGQQLVHLVRRNAAHGGFPVNQALFHHFTGNSESGHAGALPVAGLEHVNGAVLNGEFKVLHVMEVVFQHFANAHQFIEGGGHHFMKGSNGGGRTHAGHDVFTLGVHQEFAIEFVFAGGGVAGERHAGTGFLTRVAEDHGLHVDGGAPFGRNAVFLAVHDGAVIVPGTEHGANGSLKLFPGAFREFMAGAFQHQGLEAGDKFLQVIGGELGVFHVLAAEAFFLDGGDGGFKGFVVFIRGFLHTQHHVAVHLHEAAVAVPGEAGVVRSLHHGFHGFFIQAEVQNRVHHAGHGFTGAGTHGHQQGHSFRIAELASQDLFHFGNAFLDLRVKLGGISAAVIVVVSANLRRDGESGRDRKADAGHFRKVGALAAQKIFHAAIAVGGPSAERIDEFVSRCAARAGVGGHIDYCSRINDSAQTSTKGANKRPNSELGSSKDAFGPLLCQSEIVRKTKIFFRVFGEKNACQNPAFPACPVRSRSSSGQRRFLFSGGSGITWEEKRSEFLFMAARKRKTDAYQPDKRPPEIICPVFYALQKVSSSAQSA